MTAPVTFGYAGAIGAALRAVIVCVRHRLRAQLAAHVRLVRLVAIFSAPIVVAGGATLGRDLESAHA